MMSQMRFVLAGVSLARGMDGAGLGFTETGVRRVVKSDVVEVTAVGPIKRQSPAEEDVASSLLSATEQPGESSALRPLRCHIAKGSAPALDAEYAIHSYEKVAGAQDCALLCASDEKCKTFYHVKDSSHKLYQQCTLTSWAGRLEKFTQNECCDSGFPCSTDELMEHAPNVTVFPVRALAKEPVRHRHHQAHHSTSHAAAPPSKMRDQPLPQGGTVTEKEVQRLNHALEIRQHKLAEKDVEMARDTHEIKRLNNALGIRQHKMAEKDVEVAQGKQEITHLNHALGVRQNIFVEKDVQMAAEKRKEARLQAEVDSLNEELTAKSYYAYCLTSGLVIAIAMLLGAVVCIVLDRRNSLPAWLASAVATTAKQQQKTPQAAAAAQSSNPQADAQSNGQ